MILASSRPYAQRSPSVTIWCHCWESWAEALWQALWGKRHFYRDQQGYNPFNILFDEQLSPKPWQASTYLKRKEKCMESLCHAGIQMSWHCHDEHWGTKSKALFQCTWDPEGQLPPHLCSLYSGIKSLRLMNLLQAGYLRYLKFMSAHVIRAGWIHTYPEHTEVLSPLSAQHGYVWNGSNLIKDSFVLTGIRSRTLYICHPSIALEYTRVLKRDRSEDRDQSKRAAAGSWLEITSYNSVWANIKWWDREGSAPASLQINQPSSYCLVLPSAGGLLSLY